MPDTRPAMDQPAGDDLFAGTLAVVTGASGFIGSHVVDALLERGARVRVLVRAGASPSAAPTARTDRALVNYAEPESLHDALAGADYLFHLGGVTKALSRAAFHGGNVEPTRALARAAGYARQAGNGRLRRFVLVSSQAAAGPALSADRPVREDDTPKPVEEYGRSKLEAELVLARIAEQNAVPWTIVRPGAVYGPRDRDFVNVLRQAERGFALHVGSRRRMLSHVYVTDVVDGILRAAWSPASIGRAYFLAHPEPAAWADIYEAAAAAAGQRLRLQLDVPQSIINFLGVLGDAAARVSGRVTLLNSNKVALGRADAWVCATDRARAELGFAARTSLGDGMRRMFEWYRNPARA